MIEIGLDPILFTIGSFELRWYGFFVALAVMVGVLVPVLLSRRGGAGVTRREIYSIAPWAVLGGIVGSKLLHIIDQWHLYYPDNLGGIFSGGGATIFGAILGGTLAAAIAARVMGFSIGRLANLIALGLPLAQAVGRIGCTINGCCYGKPTSLPWGVICTHPNSYAYHDTFLARVAVHPTQDYELIWDLLVFATIWPLRGRLRMGWMLYLLYICLYSFGRLFISFLRVNEPFLFGLQQAQVISILVLVVGVPLLIYLAKHPAAELMEPEAQGKADDSP